MLRFYSLLSSFVVSLLWSLGANYVFNDYSGGRPARILWRQSLTFPPCNCPLRHSSANLTHCRRFYATTVAVPVFAAALCGAKFAIERLFPCFPPFIPATIWRIPPLFASLVNFEHVLKLIKLSKLAG
jgi:hypothetical protein